MADLIASPASLLTLVFAGLLVLGLGVRFWLASRQIRHVAQHRPSVPAAFAARISLAAHQKAADYTIAKTRLGLLELAWGSATLLGWTLLGGLDALNQWLLAALGGGMTQQLALLAGFGLISALLDLPSSLYQTFVLEQRFGFNHTTWRLWLLDLVKSTLLGVAIGLPIASLILWLMGAAGGLWWLWAWCAWTAFSLLLLWIFPTYIAPLFNKFEPLQDEAVRQRVTALMQRCGFSASGLFVMDGSKRSAHANAYFTGFGASKRVVFFDTLLSKLTPGEVDAVLAHELGHFRHRHVLKRMISLFATSLLGFAVLGWLSTQPWFFLGLGVQPNALALPLAARAGAAPTDALALLLFVLTLPLVTFWLGPLSAHFSRRHEFEADAYAVQQTSAADLGQALLKLYEDNASTLTPDPLYVRMYYSHPSAAERLGRMGHHG